MKKIYLIGYPIKHSKSPEMHNGWIKNLNLDQKITYELCELDNLEFKQNIKNILSSEDFLGANVTVPYKTKIIKHLDDLTPEAKNIGAVNTVIKTRNSKLLGHNTDALGFLKDLDKKKIEYKNKNILILGTGGSAKACAYILGRFSKNIDFYYRGNYLTRNKNNPQINLIINCTPLGVNKSDPLPIDHNILENLIKKNQNSIIYDLNYKHKATKLMSFVKSSQAFNGSGMLLEQARLSFQLWTNILSA